VAGPEAGTWFSARRSTWRRWQRHCRSAFFRQARHLIGDVMPFPAPTLAELVDLAFELGDQFFEVEEMAHGQGLSMAWAFSNQFHGRSAPILRCRFVALHVACDAAAPPRSPGVMLLHHRCSRSASTCVYICWVVAMSAWPSNNCRLRRSAPRARHVTGEGVPQTCGLTRSGSIAAAMATCFQQQCETLPGHGLAATAGEQHCPGTFLPATRAAAASFAAFR